MMGITVSQILIPAIAREDWITCALALINFVSFIGYIFIVNTKETNDET